MAVQSQMLPLGTRMPALSASDVKTGATVTSADFAGRPTLVMFLCNHCPYVQRIRDGIAQFGHDYDATRLAIVAISSNDPEAYPQDAPEAMKDEAERAGYVFPYLFDESQEIAKAFGAACTPDLFLFDDGGALVYRGQFDDARPGNDEPVTGRDLRAAADAVLAGQDPPGEQTPSIGCGIKWRPGNAPG